MEEQILVIKREELFKEEYFQGFSKNKKEKYLEIIQKYSYFTKRSEVEEDEGIKQIIPYQIFKYKNLYFLLRRFNTQREKRLHNKYSLGIGGHINKSDLKKQDIILRGMKREFKEEIFYKGDYDYRLIGFLNDDSEPISAVHFGLVYLIEGNSDKINVREKNKMEGKLVKSKEIENFYNKLEGWSKIIYQEYIKRWKK